MLFPQRSVRPSHLKVSTYSLILLLLFSACSNDEETKRSEVKLPATSQTAEKKDKENGETGKKEKNDDGTTESVGEGKKGGKEKSSRETSDINFITTLLTQNHKGFASITETLISKTTTYKERHRYALDCINFCCSRIGMSDDEYKQYFDAYTSWLEEHPDRLSSKEHEYMKRARIKANPDTERFFKIIELYYDFFNNTTEPTE